MQVMMIDDCFPDPRHGFGYPRAAAIIEVLRTAGCRIDLVPTQAGQDIPALPSGVSIQLSEPEHAKRQAIDLLEEDGRRYDLVWASRPSNLKLALSVLRSVRFRPPLVYDCEALRFRRNIERARLLKDAGYDASADARIELDLIAAADVIAAVSVQEAEILRPLSRLPVHVLGHRHEVVGTPGRMGLHRTDLIMLVGLHGPSNGSADLPTKQFSPNHDAIRWFVTEIWPEIRRGRPELRLVIAGHNTARIRDWPCVRPSEGIVVSGDYEDVSALYEKALCALAPTRFAAGLPWKVTEACSFGIPVLCTSLIASQLYPAQNTVLQADDAHGFAAAVAALLAPNVWNHYACCGLNYARKFHSQYQFDEAIRRILSLVAGLKSGARMPPPEALRL